jgi:DNA-binding response OmpR family regulator
MKLPLALIVEDNPQLNQIYRVALKEAFEIKSFQGAKPALDALTETIPTLVVLDLHLPDLSGRYLIEKIRSDNRLATTKIILTTADVQMADMLYEQADIVLLKPVSPNQLRELANRLCAF